MERFGVVCRLVLSIVAMTGSLACVAGVKPGVDAGTLPTNGPAAKANKKLDELILKTAFGMMPVLVSNVPDYSWLF